ncbi:TPA: restriction endonuclease subunit S [Raoultella ornithinolytica]|nr:MULTISPECIES: restriction endonuclease subunit S [Klebsiella/Raoultella group]MDD9216866.1 restriction endonuclease subunit S [Klebsiella quasipneumoniae]MDQ4640601.1 restriction endonuclease subunit S [Klebsiella quasipneumoniae subsp. similipneumoniae]WLP48968.1 restriction endonuclease subunit S [Raoultella ornithinolytica]
MEQMPVLEKYQPYPQYKDSGLGWLGQIPNHWRSIQSRRLFSSRNVKALVGDRQLAATQKYGVIFQDIFMDLEGRRVVQVQKGAEILKHVEPGDFVISMRSFQGGIEYCGHEGCVSSAYVPLIPIKWVCSDYFKYLFKSASYIQALQSTSNLVRDGQALRFENFSQIDLPVVPAEEQRTIAAFLDYETARIDKLIARQQRLIELLKEKRQAVISHAVTKGLNPDAPMKDSGVEWLGEVPEHWQVAKLSYVLKLKSGDGITSEDIEPEGSYPVFGGNGVRGYTTKYNCYGDFVLIGRQGALCGNINIAKGRFYASEHAVVVHPQKQCGITFISEFLRLMDLGQYSVSAAQPGISVERINMLYIALPPYAEQVSIGEQVTEVKTKIELLMMQASKGIELLKERRTALISAAVTGKIDLRGWTLPSEVAA